MSAAGGADLLRVVEALSLEQQLAVSQGMDEIGVRLGPGTLGLRVRMAYGMFDTRGRCGGVYLQGCMPCVTDSVMQHELPCYGRHARRMMHHPQGGFYRACARHA